MRTVQRSAKLFLISVSTHLAFGHVDENAQVWHEAFRDAEPLLTDLPAAMVPLLHCVSALVAAKPGRDRQNARTRLQIEVRKYAQGAAAYHHETLKIGGGTRHAS